MNAETERCTNVSTLYFSMEKPRQQHTPVLILRKGSDICSSTEDFVTTVKINNAPTETNKTSLNARKHKMHHFP